MCPFILVLVYCIYQSCGHVSARVRPPSSRGNTPLSNAIYCPDPLHKMKYLTHSSRLWRVQASAARGQAAAVLKCGICLNFHAVTINRQHNHPRVPRLLTQTRIESQSRDIYIYKIDFNMFFFFSFSSKFLLTKWRLSMNKHPCQRWLEENPFNRIKYCQVLIGILQRRIELDKEVLFQFNTIKHEAGLVDLTDKNPTIAPTLMKFQRGCHQVGDCR